jgi:hypothetical protein
LEAGEQDCAKHLKDLTVPLNAGEHAAVAGADLGVDTTGTYIYFVATGVLAPGATQGSPNLYVEDTSSGQTRLVAVLSSKDIPDWTAGFSGTPDNYSGSTVRVSANGRYVAFMSQESLTGYDNVDATGDEYEESGRLVPARDEEVFLYHAPADLATEPGSLTCVSCDPTNARPQGVFDPGTSQVAHLALLVDRPGYWAGQWLAGSLPGWPKVDLSSALYQPRNLTNTGRVFFDSADALVPGDANGKEDVYEYEPEGTGPEAARCTPSTNGGGEVYKPAHAYETEGAKGEAPVKGEEAAGCVGLISSGTSNEESAFMDASGIGPGGEEGEDVFFMTSAKLAPQDADSAMDVYDSHTCSNAAPCAQATLDLPPACNTTDSCRTAPPPQPEVFGAPASAAFSGQGNATPPPSAKPKPPTAAEVRSKHLKTALATCKKRFPQNKKRRATCERVAHKQFGAKKAKTK